MRISQNLVDVLLRGVQLWLLCMSVAARTSTLHHQSSHLLELDKVCFAGMSL